MAQRRRADAATGSPVLGMSGSTRICLGERGAAPIPTKRVEQIKALIEPESVGTWADVKQTPLNVLRKRAWEHGWTISTAWGAYALCKDGVCRNYADLDDVAAVVQHIEAKDLQIEA